MARRFRSGQKVGVSIEGGEELRRKLGDLADAVAGDALLQAMMAGGEVVRREAIARAPQKEGTLRRNIVVRKSGRPKRDRAAVSVGPNRKAAHGIPLELGHRLVRNGKVVGHVAPRPYLRPALDSKKGEATKAVGDELRLQIRKVAGGAA